MTRVEVLDCCDAELRDKPYLEHIFSGKWRECFRRELLAKPDKETDSYPTAYYLPILQRTWPGAYPADTQARLERGLAIVWPQMSEAERRELANRIRERDSIVAADELLAVAALADEFGESAVMWPSMPRHHRRPEFFVEAHDTRFAVECKALFDNEEVRKLNDKMLATGEPWVGGTDPSRDVLRLRRALAKKIKRKQSRDPWLMLLMNRTGWIMPDDMSDVVRQVLGSPSNVELSPSELPIAVVCLTDTIVQGVWFSPVACKAARIDSNLRERIRSAITRGFAARNDGQLLTEELWDDCE